MTIPWFRLPSCETKEKPLTSCNLKLQSRHLWNPEVCKGVREGTAVFLRPTRLKTKPWHWSPSINASRFFNWSGSCISSQGVHWPQEYHRRVDPWVWKEMAFLWQAQLSHNLWPIIYKVNQVQAAGYWELSRNRKLVNSWLSKTLIQFVHIECPLKLKWIWLEAPYLGI